MIQSKLVPALLLGTCVSFAYADEKTQQPSLTQLDLISVESLKNPTLEPVDITTSTHLSVDAQSKTVQGAASIGRLLSTLPGINNLSSGSQSGKPVVRGDTSLRLPLMSNGVMMDYQAEGTRHNPNVEPVLMENLTVIRGPEGLKYSSQSVKSALNAEGLQLDYAAPNETRTATSLLVEGNSNNQETLVGAKTKYANNGVALVAGVTKRNGGDFKSPAIATAESVKPGEQPGNQPLVSGKTPFTNFEGQAVSLGVGFLAYWGKVELHHNYWDSKQNYLGVEAQSTGYELIPSAGQALQNAETQLSAEIFKGDWIVKPRLAHTRNQRQAMHDVAYEALNSVKQDPEYLNLVVHRNDYQIAVEHPPLKGWLGEWGVSGFDKNQTLKSGHLTPSATENGLGGYVVEKLTLGQWDWEIGGRYDTHQLKAPLSDENAHFWDEAGIYDTSNNQRSYADWSGALGAAFHATSNWTFTANLGRSFRAPSIFELYASGAHGGVQAYQLGNPDLKSEISVNTEMAATWQSDQLHSTLALYANWVKDYIVLENTDETLYCDHEGACQSSQSLAFPYRKMVNAQTNALIHGVEWSAQYQATPQLLWLATAEWMQGRDTRNQRQLPLMPAPNGSLKLKYTFEPFRSTQQPFVEIGTRYVASKKMAGLYEPNSQYDGLPFGTASTSAYWLWNLKMGAQSNWGRQTLHYNLSVENLLDSAYRDFLDTYKGYALAMGRNVRLNVQWDW